MIKNNTCCVQITNRNLKYYNDKGYNCIVNDIITINIATMSRMSHNKVVAICEICSSEIELSYSKYNANRDRQGFYSCKKCSSKKRKVSCLEKYGVEHITQIDSIRENNRIWMSSKEFKRKSESTISSIYGTSSYSKTIEFKSELSVFHKERISKLKKDGIYECAFNYSDNRIKREKAMFQKYGATYSYHIPSIKEKISLKIKERQILKLEMDTLSTNSGIKYKLLEYDLYRKKSQVLFRKKKKFNI